MFWSAAGNAQLLSPGPLAQSHSTLEGDGQCTSCHSAGSGVSNAKCNGCHEEIARAQAQGAGLHGRKLKGQPCGQCHSDHHGRSFTLVRWDPKTFQHEDAGWPLRGAHAGLACNKCHRESGYIGLATACASCHKDPHETRFGSQCAACHNESSWGSLQLKHFDHERARYPLRGAHVRLPCASCHKGTPMRYKGLEFSSCTSCHQDPHRGKLGRTCENCHQVSGWRELSLQPGAHPWLSLDNGHTRVNCTQCHDRGTLRPPSRGKACVGCHRPVHEAGFGRRCETCHTGIEWLGLPRQIGLAAHGKTGYPLRGKHADAPCASCHRPELPQDQRYRRLLADRCNRCHRDPHEGRFADREKGECRTCHSESGFRPSRFGVTLHQSTRMPLEGRHAAVPCRSCHTGSLDISNKRLDWSLEKIACADCHENPHGPQFRSQMAKNGCATCHTPAAWGQARVEHRAWPLTGAHASAPCPACHTPTERDRKAGGGPSYRRAPRACEGCHEDEHRGQFRLSEPKRSCGYCHSTVEFRIQDFKHGQTTGHALEGRHATLQCDQCHGRVARSTAPSVVNYRLGYRRCRDCHADPHSEASARNSRPEASP